MIVDNRKKNFFFFLRGKAEGVVEGGESERHICWDLLVSFNVRTSSLNWGVRFFVFFSLFKGKR